jgi:hypothetical protein
VKLLRTNLLTQVTNLVKKKKLTTLLLHTVTLVV